MDDAPSEIVHAAVDELLFVVGKAAEDLRMFHDTLAKARLTPLPPFELDPENERVGEGGASGDQGRSDAGYASMKAKNKLGATP